MPKVVRGQLQHLLKATALPGLTLGIIPASAPLRIYPGDGFSLFDDRRAEVEGYRGAETITDPDRLRMFRKAFALLQPSAVYGQDALALIKATIAAM